MTCRVALATTDGASVNSHFGSAPQIIIYRLADGEWSAEEIITFENETGECSGQHEKAEERLSAVSECQYIIASRIGSRMQRFFEYQHQTYFEMPGAAVDMILTKIEKYLEKRSIQWRTLPKILQN